jgi:hypothetical protein
MSKKKCSRCKEEKLLEEFGLNNTNGKSFIKNRCKKCLNELQKEYNKTIDGLITLIYTGQRKLSRRRNHQPPSYTLKELRKWIKSQPIFQSLYDKWIESGYNRWETPSLDRLDDYKPYSFDNIRLTTWKENYDKGNSDRKNGVNNKGSKAVLQYDLEENFIKEFHSMRQVERETGFHNSCIVLACQGKLKQSYDYLWRYKENSPIPYPDKLSS